MAKKVNKTQLVAISEIIAEERYQMRAELNKAMVDRYQELYEEAPDRLPPITAIQKDEKFYLVEGFLRVEAAKKAGLEELQVIILEGDEDAGLWHAVGSNKHGLQLSWGDMKKVINIGLDAFPSKKNAERPMPNIWRRLKAASPSIKPPMPLARGATKRRRVRHDIRCLARMMTITRVTSATRTVKCIVIRSPNEFITICSEKSGCKTGTPRCVTSRLRQQRRIRPGALRAPLGRVRRTGRLEHHTP